MKLFKNKKTKYLFASLLSTIGISSIVIPICITQNNTNSSNLDVCNTKFKGINDQFISNITTLEKLNFILDKNNSNQVINQLNNSNLLPENHKIIDISFKLSNNINQINGQNVKIDYDITYDITNDNSSVITETNSNIPVGIKIIDFSINNFRTNIKNMNSTTFNNIFSQANIKNTIFDMNIGINAENTDQITVIDSYNNDDHYVQKMNMDINIQLKSNYVYNLSSNNSSVELPSFTNSIDIKKIKTKFSNYKINQNNLISQINKINSVSNVNNLLNKQKIDLNSFVENSNLVSNNELILNNSIKILGLDNNGKILLEVTTNLFGGQQIITQASTNIQAVKLDETTFKNNFKNNSSASDIENNSNKVIKNTNSIYLVNKNNDLTNNLAPLEAISNTSEFIFQDTIQEGINWLKKYNCNINLNDGYCFYDSTSNQLKETINIKELISNIVTNINLDTSFVNDLKNNLLNMTIDNYTTYFKGANKYPEEQNPGRMTLEKIKEISNNQINENICTKWSFNRSSDITGPYLKLNLKLEFKEPYTYQGMSMYTFENIETKTYDPNSEYNLNIYEWNNNEMTKIKFNEYADSVQYTNNVLYFPFKTESLNLYQSGESGAIEPGKNGWSKGYCIEKLDATFARNLVYLKGHRGFFRAKINHFDFSGLPNLIGSVYGGGRGSNSTYYFAESEGYTYNFNECPNLKYLGDRGWFKSCTMHIQWMSFTNCPSLNYLPQDVFGYYYTTNRFHVDLRGTTNITNADQSAFYRTCKNNEAWVSNDSSKNAIVNSYLNDVTVYVKSL